MFRYVAFLTIACSCWGQVTVTHAAGKWTIAGKKNTVALNESDLAVEIKAGSADWKMMPSSNRDMRVTAGSDEFYVRLAEAGNIRIAPYETGFKKGVRIVLDRFTDTGVTARALLNTRVVLTMCLEGSDEDLVFEAVKTFFDTCKEIGYVCWLHDQYRDYYLDAPSWNPDFAVHEEDSTTPPDAFPGTRFKDDWKDGYIPLMDHWDGGTQGYLNSRFMLGHLTRNYGELFERGIHPQGSYQDVFGYIPPDQDFNPNHPNTRTDSMNYRAGVLRWVKRNLGIVGTEAGSDWVIPYLDYTTPRSNRGANTGTDPQYQDAIPVPLYSLVYHDAVVSTSAANNLQGFLYGDAPQLGGRPGAQTDVETVRRMAALHKRVGKIEMTNHEFLDKDRRKERTIFADGTTVTVDWDKKTAAVNP